MLLYASIRYICFSHALKANVSQEEQQQQQEQDRGSLVYRLYLRKPVKNPVFFFKTHQHNCTWIFISYIDNFITKILLGQKFHGLSLFVQNFDNLVYENYSILVK